MKLRVPGNLLLTGEYSVLEKGGLGIALAINKYVFVSRKKSNRLKITGYFSNKKHVWFEQNDDSIFYFILKSCRDFIGNSDYVFPYSIKVDSRAFYKKNEKLGFGSSAAMTVGLCAVLLKENIKYSHKDLFYIALKAHRDYQKGKGSGYDIASSISGGVILFKGGKKPHYTSLKNTSFPGLFFLKGDSPCSTSEAIKKYEKWKNGNKKEHKKILKKNNKNIKSMLKSNISDFINNYKIAKEIGLKIGSEIGVSADFHINKNLFKKINKDKIKSLGAGNEIASIYFCNRHEGIMIERVFKNNILDIRISDKGIEWL